MCQVTFCFTCFGCFFCLVGLKGNQSDCSKDLPWAYFSANSWGLFTVCHCQTLGIKNWRRRGPELPQSCPEKQWVWTCSSMIVLNPDFGGWRTKFDLFYLANFTHFTNSTRLISFTRSNNFINYNCFTFSLNWPHWADSVIESPCLSGCVSVPSGAVFF